ncbi:MAG TPA: sigma-70 family RNA polymerase sigma factor [Gemmataceae bacterium]|nr:sigma-70 family RNA polymerase sigma factor [Gemmataceae bacterium]
MTDIAERVYRSVLVVRCQAGDRAAFEELVGLYQARLRYFLARMVGDDHAADDLLQEVWFEVYRGVARLADPGAFPAWLYRVARRRALAELRKRRPDVASLEGVDPAEEDEDDDFTAEDAERVHAALDRLPPEQREVLLLRFFEGMAYEDIAEVIGCPLGTVRSRIHYAKRALRRAMDGVPQHE